MISKDAALTGQKQKIVLEFLRDEEAESIQDNQFERDKNRIRKILVGSCKLMDPKLEKNGAYEITPSKDDKYFECDNLKGNVNGGQEIIIKFTFNPPKGDPLLKGIQALKGIGQWVESLWELKLTGGFLEAG